MVRLPVLLLLLGMIAGCKIQLSSTEGGAIETASGNYLCESGSACPNVEVVDLLFDETFIAVPEVGYDFVGWRRRDRGLCGGSTGDCRLFTAGFAGNDVLLGFLEGDEQFFLEAVFEARPVLTGDEARRAVLAAIGEKIILPALRDFDAAATTLQTAAEALRAAPANTRAQSEARAAWRAAMNAWQRNELFQVGPAGRSSGADAVPGGQDFRDFIYSWPFTLNVCSLEEAAADGDTVTGATPINITGLGAIEHLLFTGAAPARCSARPDATARAAHAARLASRVKILASALRERWEPGGDNFLEQWSTAGLASSVVYARPQDALDSLSIALFYAEKVAKDRKVALPAGLPVSGLECSDSVACPEFLESPLSRTSGANLIANLEAFRDAFTGIDRGYGVNDLLIGIGREDLAEELLDALDNVLEDLEQIEANGGFDAAVENIGNSTDCINASANAVGLAPCALQGSMKAAMDIFRAPIVSALGLAIPAAAAGDND